MEAAEQKPKPILGMYTAKADERGRVKLPVNFQEYFRSLSDPWLFVTSFDGETVRVYSSAVWQENEAFFRDHRDDDAEKAYFRAMQYGEVVEMDGQGRIQLSTEIRSKMNLVDKPVSIWLRDGVLNMIGKEVFDERDKDAGTLDKAGMSRLRVAGLK